ncbi:MAG: AMP-binding protein, partial [Cyclobacteriaceae bacterium]|nr:AMP-binding protein [Cyclobacteriaceae bacterium]
FNSDEAKDWDLAHLRLILNGAEPISADLCRAFLTRMEAFGLSNQVMFPVYGLAEACLAVTFPQPGNDFSTTLVNRFKLRVGDPVELVPVDSPHALELVKVGSPVLHCEVNICNDQGAELPDMTVGHILISGKNVTSGYYQADQINEQMITSLGLDTGDLGFIQDGQLVVCGRSKDILFFNGQNYYPHDLEFALEDLPGMELGKAVVCGATHPGHQDERPVVFALYKGDIKDFAHMIPQVRQKLNEYAGLEVNTVIPVRQIPKTTSGKVQRYQLAAQYSEGAFQEVEEKIEEILNRGKAANTAKEANTVESTLLAICQEFLEDKSIGINDNLFEMGTSSLVLTQIHDKIDEIWPGKLELTDYFDYPTIAELAQYLDEA